jgi:hypothetical protein
LGIRRGRAAAWPIALAAVFVAAWMMLDVQWIANLARQVAETREQFGGKDWRARHEAADDAEVFKFIERVRDKLPAAPARVFMLADARPCAAGARITSIRTTCCSIRSATRFRWPPRCARVTTSSCTTAAACNTTGGAPPPLRGRRFRRGRGGHVEPGAAVFRIV